MNYSFWYRRRTLPRGWARGLTATLLAVLAGLAALALRRDCGSPLETYGLCQALYDIGARDTTGDSRNVRY